MTIDLDVLLATPGPELPTFDHPDELTPIQQAFEARAGATRAPAARAEYETVAAKLLALCEAWACRLAAPADRHGHMHMAVRDTFRALIEPLRAPSRRRKRELLHVADYWQSWLENLVPPGGQPLTALEWAAQNMLGLAPGAATKMLDE